MPECYRCSSPSYVSPLYRWKAPNSFSCGCCYEKNDYFNEHVDGIIYATFVSLGFATLEGLLLLCMGDDASTNSFIYTARGILAAPVNWFLGILMGYYYSRAKFSKTKNKKMPYSPSLFRQQSIPLTIC